MILLLTTQNLYAECLPCHDNSLIINTARKYIGTKEIPKNSNRGKDIDKFLSYCGLPTGNPYCLAFVVYTYKEAYKEKGKSTPFPKIARVSMFYRWCDGHPLVVKTYSIKGLVWGAKNIEAGDVILWKSGKDISLSSNFNGHAGLAQYGYGIDKVKTIEANTTPGSEGNQRDGGGIYERDRTYGIGSKFPIIAIVRPNENL